MVTLGVVHLATLALDGRDGFGARWGPRSFRALGPRAPVSRAPCHPLPHGYGIFFLKCVRVFCVRLVRFRVPSRVSDLRFCSRGLCIIVSVSRC